MPAGPRLVPFSRSYEELLGIVREGSGQMPPISQRTISDEAVARVRTYLMSLSTDGGTQTPQSARKVMKTGIPTVDLNDKVRDTGLPQVHADHAAIARLAAEHMLERGFRHFSFFGFPVFEWSVRRRDAFAQRIRDAGCRFHDGPGTQPVSWGHQQASWEQEIESVARWIGVSLWNFTAT